MHLLKACAILFATIFSFFEMYETLQAPKLAQGRLKSSDSGTNLDEKLYSLTRPGTWYIVDFIATQYHSSCCHTPPVCPNQNVTLWFYTRKTQQYPFQLDFARPETLHNLPVVKGAQWKVIIHGYVGSRMTSPATILRNAYFRTGDYNIISVDYNELVRNSCYLISTVDIPTIANCTAQILDELIATGVMPLKNLHIIGFSMGVHVAGNIHIFLNSGVIPRVTGLEPAIVPSLRPVEALTYVANKSTAQFFDVIHSNAGFYGLDRQIGHADFWVNGGSNQHGCPKDVKAYKDIEVCDHYSTVKVYAEAILAQQRGGKRFWASPCKSVDDAVLGTCKANETNQILMGPEVSLTARGNYYLKTSGKQPYANGRVYSGTQL